MLGTVMRRNAGVTLIELMVVVALLGVIAALAAPAFKDMILMQRLRSVSSALVTDMQFARSEAVARRNFVRVQFDANADATCYSIYIYTATTGNPSTRCNCLAGPGAACSGSFVEVKTVLIAKSLGVFVAPTGSGPGWAPTFAFDWRTGGLLANPTDNLPAPMDDFVIQSYVDDTRKLNTKLNRAGRPLVCRPSGSTLSEAVCT